MYVFDTDSQHPQAPLLAVWLGLGQGQLTALSLGLVLSGVLLLAARLAGRRRPCLTASHRLRLVRGVEATEEALRAQVRRFVFETVVVWRRIKASAVLFYTPEGEYYVIRTIFVIFSD